ncbi:MAG TPA: metal-dependent hydrolase [Euryarchaeota archaeon]|nr:metal-dependent hydrolase [Euryarchaeota archaeon]
MSILIRNGTIVTQDENRRVMKGDLLIEGDEIAGIGDVGGLADEVIDATGMIVMPGLINLHTHVSMANLRGIADDVSFDKFLEITYGADANRSPEEVFKGALQGCAEMALTGTTCFLDLYYSEDMVAKAAEQAGLRAFLAWAVLDDDKTTQKGSPIENCARFIREWSGRELITPVVGPQGVYACSGETLARARELAKDNGTVCHYHLSETRGEVYDLMKREGSRPIDWLQEIGFLGEGDIAAHSVWITKHEMIALVESGVSVAHCPTSNMKLAVGGVAPVPEMRQAGGKVGLGTDGCASNNSLDMFSEMKTCSLLQKHSKWDPAIISAQEVLDMATTEGAKALGMEAQLGSLEKGKKADVVLVDARIPGMSPMNASNAVSNLVYSCSGRNVCCTIVNGKIVARNGALAGNSTG